MSTWTQFKLRLSVSLTSCSKVHLLIDFSTNRMGRTCWSTQCHPRRRRSYRRRWSYSPSYLCYLEVWDWSCWILHPCSRSSRYQVLLRTWSLRRWLPTQAHRPLQRSRTPRPYSRWWWRASLYCESLFDCTRFWATCWFFLSSTQFGSDDPYASELSESLMRPILFHKTEAKHSWLNRRFHRRDWICPRYWIRCRRWRLFRHSLILRRCDKDLRAHLGYPICFREQHEEVQEVSEEGEEVDFR